METKKFFSLFREYARIEKTAQALADKQARVHWKGLVGSSRSICAAAVADQVP